jgi:hypothetical protein
MTEFDKGQFAKKHGPDRQPVPEVAAAVKQRAQDGQISCTAAFEIAEDRKASPAEVGLAIDCLEISIVKCQLGLFGYGPQRSIVKPAADVPRELEGTIRKHLVEGRLPCAVSWKIAADLDLPKMGVSSACERLGIRFSACQLGAF